MSFKLSVHLSQVVYQALTYLQKGRESACLTNLSVKLVMQVIWEVFLQQKVLLLTFTGVITEYATFSKIHCICREVASIVVLICVFLMHCAGLWRCRQQWRIVTWYNTSPRRQMRAQIRPPSSTGMPRTLLVLRVGVLSGGYKRKVNNLSVIILHCKFRILMSMQYWFLIISNSKMCTAKSISYHVRPISQHSRLFASPEAKPNAASLYTELAQ